MGTGHFTNELMRLWKARSKVLVYSDPLTVSMVQIPIIRRALLLGMVIYFLLILSHVEARREVQALRM